MSIDKESIRRRALELVADDHHGVAGRLAAEFGLSRQVANGYLQTMEREGLLESSGSTRSKTYRLRTLGERSQSFARDGLEEHLVWREVVAPEVALMPENVRRIWHYGSTEMINNAIDHSGSALVSVSVVRNGLFTIVTVADQGEGIFLKIQRALGLAEPREAILELAKGKLTTAPEHHSGEGIFFTSRAVDVFEIESHTLRFRHAAGAADVMVEHGSDTPGTRVTMRLANESPRVLKDVFDQFSESEDFGFEKTVVPLRLAQVEGEMLVSRSQAKRVANRFERFKQVELDFAGIDEVGQAFADELFRVFAAAHPAIRMTPVNANENVARMIRRAVAARDEGR
jgi:DNA-binding MarR family transcriptional regulator